jgi:hypothetical protein
MSQISLKYKKLFSSPGGGGISEVNNTNLPVVTNYSALPPANTVSGKFYWCSEAQGTWWLPGGLGGTYYNKGLYYSNGTTWEYIDTPYQATQAEVNTGTNDDKFVTPLTLYNSSQWATKENLVNQSHSVFVSKVGNDANNGLSVSNAKLTISDAIIAASALITGGATGVRINVIDGGTYTENITVPTNIAIDAKGATLIGTASVTGGSELFLDRHFASANNQAMLTCEGAGTGQAIYWTNISDGRGTGGSFTGVRNIRNVGGGGRNLYAKVGILFTSEGGTGVGDVSTGDAGHIHIELLDLYLAGDNAVGILGSSQGAGDSNIVGWIDHIIEIGSQTNTTAISLTTAGAVVKLTTSEIVADTAYNISAGSLYLSCPKITGAVVGTPVQQMVGTIELETRSTFDEFISGQWNMPPFTLISTAASWNNVIWYSPFIIRRKITLTEIGLNVNAGTAGGTVRLAIYNSLNAAPNDLLYETGLIDGTSQGIKSELITPNLVLQPGLYFRAAQVSSNLINVRFGRIVGLIGSSTAANANHSCFITNGYSYSTFPATATTTLTSADNALLILLRPL